MIDIRPALVLYSYIGTCCQQMQSLSVEPILVPALGQSTWTMLAALAVRPPSIPALEALLSAVPVAMQRMQEYDVKVWKNDALVYHFEMFLLIQQKASSSTEYLHSARTIFQQ